jgi:hypothetical protein
MNIIIEQADKNMYDDKASKRNSPPHPQLL